ncbi:MAG: FliM/FliN family flagellar motor switch protein [Deltaproteobacteria bacterium]|nr:FliM/FliN family flagellar motor switch protein [Deltaproteobacteria bacterium]
MSERHPVSFLSELPVDVVVELGRTRLTVRQLAELDRDDVVDLGRGSDTPLDLVVGGRVIARGEVVMVGDKLALRITEMVGDESARSDS